MMGSKYSSLSNTNMIGGPSASDVLEFTLISSGYNDAKCCNFESLLLIEDSLDYIYSIPWLSISYPGHTAIAHRKPFFPSDFRRGPRSGGPAERLHTAAGPQT